MNKTEIFLEKYKELEAAASDVYKLSENDKPIACLEKKPEFWYEKQKLKYCREVRNFCQHTIKDNSEFLVTPSDQMIELISQLIEKVRNLPRGKDYAVSFDKVFSCNLGDYVQLAMKTMREHNYTHIPVLEQGKIIGVFSENTLFSYILDNEIVSIDKDTKFRDLGNYLAVKDHETETFYFLPWDVLISNVKKLFEDALSRMERIGMIFLTKSGKETEKPMGILTSWDILGN